MNTDKLFRILGIKYNIRHSGRGLIYTVFCPYCSGGWHKHKTPTGAFLEYNNKLHYTCFRGCSASVIEVLHELSGESIEDIKEALSLCSSEYKKQYEKEEQKDVFILPEDVGISQKYRDYLSSRGLNAEYVTKKYNLRFTPELPYNYHNMNMSNCIVFPVYNFNNKPVSFTARTVSPTAVIRYLFPPSNIEAESGKEIGFGHNGVEDKSFVVICEGVFDALKLDSIGVPAIACLGINYTHGFVTNIVKHYKSAMVIFDPEPQAQKQQMKLVNELSLLIPTYTIQYPFTHDLGDCTYGELKTLKELIKNKKNF